MVLLYVVLGVLLLSFIPVTVLTVRAFRRYRGRRMVTCPETHRSAAIELDSGHAAFTTAMGQRELRVEKCGRWPDRGNCDQECVAQIETA
jgi:hypothetical protein